LEISIDEVCELIAISCGGSEVEVIEKPTEGVLFESSGRDKVFYQHAGTSLAVDTFKVKFAKSDDSGLVRIFLRVSDHAPKVQILEPLQSQLFTEDRVQVIFKVKGEGADHIHFKVNDEDHISLPLEQSSYEIDNLASGWHKVELSLATKNHRVIPGSAVQASFLVQLP
jgi:hypothetical protein